jgi:lambda repressor-like predicted transcriptional regulator
VKLRQAQRRLTPQQVERLVAEYEAGTDMKALAARWTMHRATVAAQLRRAGVVLRRQGVPEDKLHEAVRLYAEGWSCQRLAERYRCDDETVRQTLKRAGVRLRAPWERL